MRRKREREGGLTDALLEEVPSCIEVWRESGKQLAAVEGRFGGVKGEERRGRERKETRTAVLTTAVW
jgi:hypothetical protein